MIGIIIHVWYYIILNDTNTIIFQWQLSSFPMELVLFSPWPLFVMSSACPKIRQCPSCFPAFTGVKINFPEWLFTSLSSESYFATSQSWQLNKTLSIIPSRIASLVDNNAIKYWFYELIIVCEFSYHVIVDTFSNKDINICNHARKISGKHMIVHDKIWFIEHSESICSSCN